MQYLFVKLLFLVVILFLYFIPKLSVYDHKLTASELRPDEEGTQDGHNEWDAVAGHLHLSLSSLTSRALNFVKREEVERSGSERGEE